MERELQNCIERLQTAMDAISADICKRFPISGYVHDVRHFTALRMHSFFGSRRKRIFNQIGKIYGADSLALYHKLALAHLMKDSLERLPAHSFPKSTINNFFSWYERVMKDFDSLPAGYYDISKFDFKTDIGVCCLKNIPVGGAWFVLSHMISPRSFITFDFRNLQRLVGGIVIRTGGLSPYYVIHTYPRYIMRFNCRQMNLAYIEIGALMKSNPKIKGIFRKSWLLDPHLQYVSPELCYLREVPVENGAILFKVGATGSDVKDALSLSSNRRKLYNEGKYIPAVYGYIWPRMEFLRWLGTQAEEAKSLDSTIK
jgi:hypothetical protein